MRGIKVRGINLRREELTLDESELRSAHYSYTHTYMHLHIYVWRENAIHVYIYKYMHIAYATG